MQSARNKQLLFSLILLSVITIIAYFLSITDGQFELDKKMFQVDDQTKINRVVFESAGKKVIVSYDGTSWKINNKYPADRQLVKVLFATLLQIAPKRPASETLKDSISKSLQSSGTKVSLFEGKDLKKEFYAGSNSDHTQTYFQQNSELPYLVTIPGYRVDPSQVFQLDENGWRDKRVFNFNWRNLKDISVRYPAEPKRDFKINLRQKLLSMEDVEVTDTTRLSRFVDDLYSLEADQIVKVGEKPPMDTLFMQLTSFELVVSDIASRKFKLEVKQWKLGQPQLAGVSNDSLLLLFDKTKIFRIAKTKDYFKKRE
jgi:hypothetical protein